MSRKLLLVDGNSIANRAYYGGPFLTNAEGQGIGTLRTFFLILLRFFQPEQLPYLAIAFDAPHKTFRHEQFSAYKGTRKPADEQFIEQLKLLKQAIVEMGLYQLELPGYEADDIVGTWSRLAQADFDEIELLSGDRDYLQLVDAQTKLLYPKGLGEVITYTPETVHEEYGSWPQHFIHLKALQGDSSDNIPGLPGVGPKTARKWLADYPTIPELYAHFDSLDPKIQKKLSGQEAYLKEMLELVTIDRQTPGVLPHWDEMKLGAQQLLQIARVLERYGVHQLAQRVSKLKPNPDATKLGSQMGLDERTEGLPQPPAGSVEVKSLPEDEALEGLLTPDQPPCPLLYRPAKRGEAACPAQAWVYQPQTHTLYTLTQADFERLLAQTPAVQGPDPLQPDLFAQLCQPSRAEQPTSHAPTRLVTFSLVELQQGFSKAATASKILDLSLVHYPTDCEVSIKTPMDLAAHYAVDSQVLDAYRRAYLQGENAVETLALEGELLAQLFDLVWKRVEAENLTLLVETVDLPLADVLKALNERGIGVNAEKLSQAGDAFSQALDAHKSRILELAGTSFNLASPSQLGQVLYEKLGLPAKKRKTGAYATDAAYLTSIVDRHPILSEILAYRKLHKLQTTYVEGLQAHLQPKDQRIHSVFLQRSTHTGRLSSTQPNLQNLPIRQPEGRVFREAIEARPGWRLVDADYSQVELRLMAHLSGDQALIAAFQAQEDIHARTAAELFEVGLDAVTTEMRGVGKTINFSVIYGVTGYGLAGDLGVSFAEANAFIQRYFQRYPQVKAYLEGLEKQVLSQGYVQTLWGRRIQFQDLHRLKGPAREQQLRAAKNAPIQGTAADLMRLAMVRVEQRLAQEKSPAQLVLQIHDELILEAPEAIARQTARLLVEEMQAVAALDVPLIADVGIGQNWMEAKQSCISLD